MLLTAQNSALVTLFGLLGWFTGHQGSHCAYLSIGATHRATPLNPFLRLIMEVETFSGFGFLIWYAYMTGIYSALKLLGLALIFSLALYKVANWVGLNRQAWLISMSGIAIVPVLLLSLIWLVLFPISN
jgi:hypothetical protein